MYAESVDEAEQYALAQYKDYPEWVLEAEVETVTIASVTELDEDDLPNEAALDDYMDWKTDDQG